MPISIYRWTDGPYLGFDDQDNKRYLIERSRAEQLLQRLSAHLDDAADQRLVIDRRFRRDPTRDLVVLELYYQDCDNCFEAVTGTGPDLILSPVETGTILRLALECTADGGFRRLPATPSFVQDAAVSILANGSGELGAPYG